MSKFPTLVLITFLFVSQSVYAAENVVLITLDGLRWQELFRGLDANLANHEEYSGQSQLITERFQRRNPEQSAAAVFPFLHSVVFTQGQLHWQS
jgi:hypothetical protein